MLTVLHFPDEFSFWGLRVPDLWVLATMLQSRIPTLPDNLESPGYRLDLLVSRTGCQIFWIHWICLKYVVPWGLWMFINFFVKLEELYVLGSLFLGVDKRLTFSQNWQLWCWYLIAKYSFVIFKSFFSKLCQAILKFKVKFNLLIKQQKNDCPTKNHIHTFCVMHIIWLWL